MFDWDQKTSFTEVEQQIKHKLVGDDCLLQTVTPSIDKGIKL
jgi:hypothetical protein